MTVLYTYFHAKCLLFGQVVSGANRCGLGENGGLGDTPPTVLQWPVFRRHFDRFTNIAGNPNRPPMYMVGSGITERYLNEVSEGEKVCVCGERREREREREESVCGRETKEIERERPRARERERENEREREQESKRRHSTIRSERRAGEREGEKR